jgi:hypothetical protein
MTEKIITIEDQIKAIEITIGYYTVELKKKSFIVEWDAYSCHIEKLKAAKKTLEGIKSKRADTGAG